MIYLKYLKYVIRHKWFVFLACRRMGITWRGIVHDMSKLLPSEFVPYARHFYGNGGDIKTGRDKSGHYSAGNMGDAPFDYAWLLHQKRNKHHWQWWLLPLDDGGTKYFTMPQKAIKEMIADWVGAGIAIAGISDPLPWYEANKHNIHLNDTTKTIVEANLKYISECPEWDIKRYMVT